jgi:hypothetical protein
MTNTQRLIAATRPQFILWNPDMDLYWSEKDGWGDPGSATRFMLSQLVSGLNWTLEFSIIVHQSHGADWIDPVTA